MPFCIQRLKNPVTLVRNPLLRVFVISGIRQGARGRVAIQHSLPLHTVLYYYTPRGLVHQGLDTSAMLN